ncbi:MFS transporter [Sulfobacillus sp. hq2]|uniref:MFS transporter n=1 Tax=Sulfobacillus TaxID=28033 RepID=UPI001304D463|nr:MFS transporter [Sulfobacillus sp. hq2]
MSSNPAPVQHTPLPRSVVRLIIAQTFSIFGDDFTEVAIAIFALDVSRHNPAALGLVLSMVFWPGVIWSGVVAGFIDRLNKRMVLIAGDLLRAILVLSIPLIHSLSWATVAMFLMYSLATFYRPVIRSVQPSLAGNPDTNDRANAQMELWSSTAQVVSYIAAGFLILKFGVTFGFGVDALTFMISAVAIYSIQTSPSFWAPTTKNQRGTFLRSIVEAIQYYRSAPTLMILTAISIVAMMALGGANVLTAPAMRSLWHQPTAHYSWALVAIAFGAMLGSRGLQRWLRPENYRRLMLIGFAGMALTMFAVSHVHEIILALSILFVSGLLNVFFNGSIITWIQRTTPEAMRPRVLTLRGLILGVGGGIGAFGAGLIAKTFGLVPAFTVIGVLLLLGVIGALRLKSIPQ